MSRAQRSHRPARAPRATVATNKPPVELSQGGIFQLRGSVQSVLSTVTSAQSALSRPRRSVVADSSAQNTKNTKNPGKVRPCIIFTSPVEGAQVTLAWMSTLEGLDPTLSCFEQQFLLVPVNNTPDLSLKGADNKQRVSVQPEAAWPNNNHSYVLAAAITVIGRTARFEPYTGDPGTTSTDTQFCVSTEELVRLAAWCTERAEIIENWSPETTEAAKASSLTRQNLMKHLRFLDDLMEAREKVGDYDGLPPDELEDLDRLYNSHLQQVALASGDDLPPPTLFPPEALPVEPKGSFWRLRPYLEARIRLRMFNYEYEMRTDRDQGEQVQRIFAVVSGYQTDPTDPTGAKDAQSRLVRALAEIVRVAAEEPQLLHPGFRFKSEAELAKIVRTDQGLASVLERLFSRRVQSWVLHSILNYVQQPV